MCSSGKCCLHPPCKGCKRRLRGTHRCVKTTASGSQGAKVPHVQQAQGAGSGQHTASHLPHGAAASQHQASGARLLPGSRVADTPRFEAPPGPQGEAHCSLSAAAENPLLEGMHFLEQLSWQRAAQVQPQPQPQQSRWVRMERAGLGNPQADSTEWGGMYRDHPMPGMGEQK